MFLASSRNLLLKLQGGDFFKVQKGKGIGMLCVKSICLLLLLFVGKVFGFGRIDLPALVTEHGPSKFYLDENFKRHHPALLDCSDLSYMRDLRAAYKTTSLDATFAWSIDFCHGCVLANVPGFLAKADDTIQARTADLAARGYTLRNLVQPDGSQADNPMVFAYSAATKTLIIALSGLDWFWAKRDAEKDLTPYKPMNKEMSGQISLSLLVRASAEFKKVVLPSFMALWATLDADDKTSLSVIFTGHAFGSERAMVHAMLLGEVLSTKDFYGDSFAGSNMIQVYSLCGRCIGNQKFTEYVYDLLGRDNIINQAVIVDQAPEAQALAQRAVAAGWLAILKHPRNDAPACIGWRAYDRDCAFLRRSNEEHRAGWIEAKLP